MISFEELKEGLMKWELSLERFNVFDTDDSGELNFNEFIYVMNWLGDTWASIIINSCVHNWPERDTEGIN